MLSGVYKRVFNSTDFLNKSVYNINTFQIKTSLSLSKFVMISKIYKPFV